LINQSHGRARDRASLHASRVCWRRQTVHHWSTRITGRSDGGEAATQFPRCRCLSACRFRRDRLTVRMDRHGVQPSIVQGLIIIQNTQASRRPCLPACRICRIGQGKGQSKARPWRRRRRRGQQGQTPLRFAIRMDRRGVQPSIVQGLIIIQNTQASRRFCLPARRICRIGQGTRQSTARRGEGKQWRSRRGWWTRRAHGPTCKRQEERSRSLCIFESRILEKAAVRLSGYRGRYVCNCVCVIVCV